MKDLLNKVAEFQHATGQTVNIEPTAIKEMGLRYNLMKEENDEYINSKDLIDVLDALVDQAYVLFGTINSQGMQDIFLEAFNRVHANNMTKVVDGKVIRDADGKILKPNGFKPVVLTDLI